MEQKHPLRPLHASGLPYFSYGREARVPYNNKNSRTIEPKEQSNKSYSHLVFKPSKFSGMKENHAEIHFSKEGSAPRVELVLPHGTKLESLLKMQALISRDVISKISPRGCQACLSGVHFNIRERLENVLLVNLETMKYV